MEITRPMIQYFNNRTKKHIEYVNYFAKKVGYSFPNHDSDKFNSDLTNPYIILSWCSFKKQPLPTKGYDELINAMKSHYATNKHHPEYWENIDDMDKESLIEMCADWCAMSKEYNNDPFNWADNNINIRWSFNDKQIKFIYNTMNIMWSDE